LHHRQVGGLRALEDAAGIHASLPKSLRQARPVAHQAAGLGVIAGVIDRGQGVARRQRGKLDAPAKEKGIGANDKGFDTMVGKRREGRLDATNVPRLGSDDLNTDGRRGLCHLAFHGFGIRVVGIDEQPDPGGSRNNLAQQSQLLGTETR
jgi:hypothetical protein